MACLEVWPTHSCCQGRYAFDQLKRYFDVPLATPPSPSLLSTGARLGRGICQNSGSLDDPGRTDVTAARRGMSTGSIRQNDSGTWQARVRQANGERLSLGSFRTKREAQTALHTALADQSRGSWVDPRAGRQTFEKYATNWLAHRTGLRARTLELYESQLRNYLVPAFGSCELNQITPVEVRLWFSELTKRGKPSPATCSKLYRLLRTILNTAVEDELIPKNACNIKGAGNELSAERPVATIEQVEALAEGVEERYRVLVYLATYTTLRFGELFGLRRRDIDLGSGRVEVTQQVGHLAGGQLVFGPPKSAAGRRTVAIPNFLLPDVQAHLDRFVGPGPDQFVFRGASGIVPRRSNWSTMWRRVALKADVEGLRFHDLRHTGNTLAAATGASTKELMARMGHASPRAALIYQHATREREDAIAAGLDTMVRLRRA